MCSLKLHDSFLGTTLLLNIFVTAQAYAQAEFIGLPMQPTYGTSDAYAISADGTTVVGKYFLDASGSSKPVRWIVGQPTPDYLGLDPLPAPPHSIAHSVTSDGTIAVGGGPSDACSATFSDTMALLWAEDSLAQDIGFAAECPAYALFISDDGTIIAGGADFNNNGAVSYEPAYKTITGSWQQLDGAANNLCAIDLVLGGSPDGRYLVGGAQDTPGWHAFIYDSFTDTTTIIQDLLPNSGPNCGNIDTWAFAHDVNADGTIVVGRGRAATNEAFVWTPSGGTVGLGDFGTQVNSRAWAVHPTELLIVGFGFIDDGSGCSPGITCRHAAIWDSNLQIHRLHDWATARGVVIPAGWRLIIARDIRQVGDRVFICGTGEAPSGRLEAFLLKIPLTIEELCPADLAGDDGTVDVFDLFVILGNWGSNGSGADLAAPFDTVDVFDLFVLLNAWGDCP